METTANSFINKILVPDERECQLDALPLPPPVVDSITTGDAVITDVLEDMLGGLVGIVSVWVEWELQGGSEGAYDVRVTENAAQEDSDDAGEEFALQRVNVCFRISLH